MDDLTGRPSIDQLISSVLPSQQNSWSALKLKSRKTSRWLS